MSEIKFKVKDSGKIFEVCYDSSITIRDFILDFTKKHAIYSSTDPKIYTFKLNAKILNSPKFLEKKLKDVIFKENVVYFVRKLSMSYSGGEWYHKTINIKFIKLPKSVSYPKYYQDIFGLLKLCLLKEISQKISDEKLKKLPELIYCIMNVISKGYIFDNDIKKNIQEIMQKTEGSSIINFSNYVDEIIDHNQMNTILNLLTENDLKEMTDINNRLSKYNHCITLFNKEFEKAKRESFLEFSVVSCVIIEREDFDVFEKEREKCPNRVERILYHGTSIEPISCILTGLYRKSLEAGKCINGKGVYFTDSLDYGWFYGGKDNRINCYVIPKINDTFTMIVNSLYYDRNGFEKVKDSTRTPGKNQINFAYAGAGTERISQPDKSKFFATEYVIYELDQICPFMSLTLKREQYCVIWRDNNFSSKPVYNNEFDQKFKKFLKERMNYINQTAKYNIYPCETTEEALELVKRKKYNKIILISNVGTDLGGKIFIDKARQIIGKNTIALFLAYRTSHLDWIKNYKNALFSNEPKFYEEYLKCFEGNYVYPNIKNLVENLEKHYNVKFNFDDDFLDYPYFKNEGEYFDMRF